MPEIYRNYKNKQKMGHEHSKSNVHDLKLIPNMTSYGNESDFSKFPKDTHNIVLQTSPTPDLGQSNHSFTGEFNGGNSIQGRGHLQSQQHGRVDGGTGWMRGLRNKLNSAYSGITGSNNVSKKN